jgi:predicted dehydrogenase
VNVAIAGAGVIAAEYARCIRAEARIHLLGATDPQPGRAAALGGVDYASLDELLADDRVEAVVNLTPASAHAGITRACLEAGKHVHTEKPVALHGEEAWALAALARERGVRLSCAPATLLGEAQQTAWKLVRDGAIGTVRAVYAEANWGRIETWHPSPETLYDVGPLADVGIYPLTIVTAMFGPVRRVSGYATTLLPQRVSKDGAPFTPAAPDFWVAALELESGVVVRLTASFWVSPSKQRGLEFHGDSGSLWMPTWSDFDSRIEMSGDGESYTSMSLLQEPYRGVDWARALVDLADALARDRPHRMSAEHAAHVVDALNGIDRARTDGGGVEIVSSFRQPEPMDWAR